MNNRVPIGELKTGPNPFLRAPLLRKPPVVRDVHLKGMIYFRPGGPFTLKILERENRIPSSISFFRTREIDLTSLGRKSLVLSLGIILRYQSLLE